MTRRRFAHAFTLALAALLAQACTSECEEYFDVREECGTNDDDDDVEELRAQCEESIEEEACAGGYRSLNACIGELEDACDYSDACSAEIYEVALRCD
jgi:hypothetical protein